jgi:aspartate/methionine/tyrosine aminotransferase
MEGAIVASEERDDRLQRFLSQRGRRTTPFLVMEVLERAGVLEREGRSIIHLEVGEPDFKTPEVVREAGIKAILDGHTHYTHSQGRSELREAISEWHWNRYGTQVSPERIVVASGSSTAMVLAFASLLDSGDEVLLTDPCYACYPKFVTVFDGVPVSIAVSEEDGFQYPIEAVKGRLSPKVKAILLNSPSNPTGTMASADRIRELVEVTSGRVLTVSDEIYHGLEYGEKGRSILEFTDDAIVINGFSKLFAMTGWRLGYAIFPEYMVRAVQKLQQNLFISAPDFAQIAARTALKEAVDDVEAMRQEYDVRRRFVLRRLRDIGFEIPVEPTGAFYVFINVSRYTQNVLDFTFQILEQAGVAVTPGVDFGSNGEGFVRICYANSMENLEEGMNRLEQFWGGLT